MQLSKVNLVNHIIFKPGLSSVYRKDIGRQICRRSKVTMVVKILYFHLPSKI
jgi:hypothetical protein